MRRAGAALWFANIWVPRKCRVFLPVLCCLLTLIKLCLFPAVGIRLQLRVISRAAASFVPEMQTVANKHLKALCAAMGKPQTLQRFGSGKLLPKGRQLRGSAQELPRARRGDARPAWPQRVTPGQAGQCLLSPKGTQLGFTRAGGPGSSCPRNPAKNPPWEGFYTSACAAVRRFGANALLGLPDSSELALGRVKEQAGVAWGCSGSPGPGGTGGFRPLVELPSWGVGERQCLWPSWELQNLFCPEVGLSCSLFPFSCQSICCPVHFPSPVPPVVQTIEIFYLIPPKTLI